MVFVYTKTQQKKAKKPVFVKMEKIVFFAFFEKIEKNAFFSYFWLFFEELKQIETDVKQTFL